jgi:hypothetical protein
MALALAEFSDNILSFHAPEHTRQVSPRGMDVEPEDDLTEDFVDDDEDNTGPREAKSLATDQSSVSGSDQPRNLNTLTLALSDETGLQELNQAQQTFYRAIRDLVPSVRRHNRAIVQPFSDNEAVDITNFFFSEVMGKAALGRLNSLISYYTAGGETDPDAGAAARAAALTHSRETTYGPLREFYQSFSKVQCGKASKSSIFGSVQQTMFSLELLAHYDQLCHLAHQQKSSTSPHPGRRRVAHLKRRRIHYLGRSIPHSGPAASISDRAAEYMPSCAWCI